MIKQWLGIQNKTTTAENIASTVGAAIALYIVASIGQYFLGPSGIVVIIPSIGASAVLLFAMPHGTLSQPWALLAGNIVSAAIGVTCARLIPDIALASGLAVGFSIGAMYLLRCIHPPGGATALAAVIGGDSVHELGYQFILTPVLLSCLALLLIALLFNNLFAWRRYPISAMKFRPVSINRKQIGPQISHIERALQHLGSVVDVSAPELQQIFERAEQMRQQDIMAQFDFELGGVYSNDRPGALWSVRKIIDYAGHPDPNKDLIIYKVLEGARKNYTASCTRVDFAQWAKQRLQPAKQK